MSSCSHSTWQEKAMISMRDQVQTQSSSEDEKRLRAARRSFIDLELRCMKDGKLL